MEVGDKDERAELETCVKEERDVNASLTRHTCQTHVSASSDDRARAPRPRRLWRLHRAVSSSFLLST